LSARASRTKSVLMVADESSCALLSSVLVNSQARSISPDAA
jgi:hypothetical protein